MGAKDLLPEFVLTVRAELLRRDLICDRHSVLLIVLSPDRFFVQLARFSLSVHVTYLLHLKALFESFKFVKVLLLKHLSNQEPVQVVLLQAHLLRGLLVRTQPCHR